MTETLNVLTITLKYITCSVVTESNSLQNNNVRANILSVYTCTRKGQPVV